MCSEATNERKCEFGSSESSRRSKSLRFLELLQIIDVLGSEYLREMIDEQLQSDDPFQFCTSSLDLYASIFEKE